MALKRSLHISIAVLFAAGAACAESREMTSDEFGTHNPEELTLHGALDRLEHGESHPMEYAMGLFRGESGDCMTKRNDCLKALSRNLQARRV